jgi:hypothetical protein
VRLNVQTVLLFGFIPAGAGIFIALGWNLFVAVVVGGTLGSLYSWSVVKGLAYWTFFVHIGKQARVRTPFLLASLALCLLACGLSVLPWGRKLLSEPTAWVVTVLVGIWSFSFLGILCGSRNVMLKGRLWARCSRLIKRKDFDKAVSLCEAVAANMVTNYPRYQADLAEVHSCHALMLSHAGRAAEAGQQMKIVLVGGDVPPMAHYLAALVFLHTEKGLAVSELTVSIRQGGDGYRTMASRVPELAELLKEAE